MLTEMPVIVAILVKYTVGPFVIGSVLFWCIHQVVGLAAQIRAGDSAERMEDIKMSYIFRITLLKEYTWNWAIGLAILIIIGIVR